MKKRTRVEVVTPEWVKDPSKWPFGKIILPTPMKAPRRLLVSPQVLSQQMGCDIALVRAFIKFGQVAEGVDVKKRAQIGLCAEDIAALGLTGLVMAKYNLKIGRNVGELLTTLHDELLSAPRPLRVILGVFRGNDRTETRVGTCQGPLAVFDVGKEQAAATTFYDASDLRDRIDVAMELSPLRLPHPVTCAVKRP